MNENLDLEGKKYISAKRASEISGYNSDYLGQLCRAGKLECKLVSRAWFVTEKSLRDHQNTNGRKKYGLREHVINEPVFFTENEKILFAQEKSEVFKSNQFSKKSVFDKKLVFSLFLVLFVSVTSFASVFNFDESYLRNNILNKYADNFLSTLEEKAPKDFQLASLSLEKMKDNFSNNYLSLKNKIKIIAAAIFNRDENYNYLAQEVFRNEQNNTVHFAPEDDKGAVMIPISKSESSDNNLSKVRNYLRSSFSDEIEIVPDESGVSGVIKPVFSDPKDEEYFYVMVPVN